MKTIQDEIKEIIAVLYHLTKSEIETVMGA